jgi:excisionase family DNA binding protein
MPETAQCRTRTIEQAAKALGIGRNQAYEAARRGEIPTIRIGKRVLVPTAALERLLAGESNQAKPA